MKHEQHQFLQTIVARAMDTGAQGAEAIMGRSNSLSIRAFDQKVEQYSVSSSQVLGVRLRQDDKIGIAYCESMDEASVAAMLDDARNNARWMDADEHEHINTPPSCADVLRNERNFQSDNATINEKIDLPLALERQMLARGPEVKSVPYCGLGENESESFMVTSNGIFTHARSRSLSCYVQALLSNGQDNMTHYRTSSERTFDRLEPRRCIEEAYHFAKDMLGAKKITGGQYSVIFTPEALSEFFSSFGVCLSGRAAREGQNPWRDQVGKSVAAPQLTLRDVPHYANAFSYALFDSEGNLHRDLTLIERGVLRTFYHNSATAHYFGVANNACATRSAKGRMGVSGTNLLIEAGSECERNVLDGTFLEIHAMQGLHSGNDAISGVFSFGAKGYLWQQGVATPVKDITIAGNFYKMLQQIEAIGDVIHSDNSRSFFAPLIRWSGVTTSC